MPITAFAPFATACDQFLAPPFRNALENEGTTDAIAAPAPTLEVIFVNAGTPDPALPEEKLDA